MKTQFKTVSVDRIFDIKYDPPSRYQVRLESDGGETLLLTGLRAERVIAFAQVGEDGQLVERTNGKLLPVETAFFVSAEKQSKNA